MHAEQPVEDNPPDSSHASLPCSSIKAFFVNEVVSLFQKPSTDASKIQQWCDWLVCPSTLGGVIEHSSQQQVRVSSVPLQLDDLLFAVIGPETEQHETSLWACVSARRDSIQLPHMSKRQHLRDMLRVLQKW